VCKKYYIYHLIFRQLSSEKVDIPSVATVGQVIAVKAVDNNGKPIKWEAVDMANGGQEGIEFNPLYGKKISLIGDSICAGSSESTSHLGGYGKIIADRNNMVYQNVARAGSTITAETYSSSTGNAKGWICRMVAQMDADADYAIVEGGINDAWQWHDHKNIEIGEISNGYNAELDDTTYYGAFESMLKQLVTKFQGKKVGYIAIPKMMNLYDSNRNAPNFYHIALECCAKWGVSVCDLNTIIPPTEYLKTLGTTYTADGTHPTYEGYLKYYCDPIEAWMKTMTTSGNFATGTQTANNDEYIRKSDISTKKAKLTLEDGTEILVDVVVASAGSTIDKYINQVLKSINPDGSIYNGVGYESGLRLSSTGVTKSQGQSVVCGYIPAKAGDVIRLGGIKWWNTGGTNYLCAYDSNFTYIGAVYGHQGLSYGTAIHSAIDYGDEVTTVTLANNSNIAYIRANWCNGSNIDNTYGNIILTVNQEITD
jgi:lysophospholipase L1-like esterase